jgi:hypothetical protein
MRETNKFIAEGLHYRVPSTTILLYDCCKETLDIECRHKIPPILKE